MRIVVDIDDSKLDKHKDSFEDIKKFTIDSIVDSINEGIDYGRTEEYLWDELEDLSDNEISKISKDIQDSVKIKVEKG